MSMTDSIPKRKVSLSLDAEVVEAFERDGPLSAQINVALRQAVSRRAHQRALAELLDQFELEDGPMDSPDDKAAIARYIELLS